MVAATLLAGIGPAASTATAAEGDGVVFPAAVAAQPRNVIPLAAGPHGYLRYEQGRGQFWTTYDGVTSSPVYNDREGPEADGTYGAGSDIVAAYESKGLFLPGEVRLWDVLGKSNTYVELPSLRHQYIGTFGTTVVTFTQSTETAPREWHLLRLVNGSVQDTVVTGWPEGALPAAKAVTGDAQGILTSYQADGVARTVWIDLASAKVRPLAPSQDAPSATVSFVHTPTEIVEWTKDGKVRFYAKGEAGTGTAASGPLSQASTTDLAHHDGDVLLGVVGERIVVGRISGQSSSAPYRVVSVPRTGGEETTLFAHGRKDAMATPDGGLLVVAGATADALGVQRLRADADGTSTGRLTDVTPLTSKPRSFSFSHGHLQALERMTDEANAFRSRTVSVTGELTAGPTQERGDLGLPLERCTDRNPCQDPFATDDGRIVAQPGYQSESLPVVAEQGATSGRPVSDQFTSLQIGAVSGRYAIVSGELKTGGWVYNTALDLDTGKPLASFRIPFDYALYGDTLWTQGATDGTVVGHDVRTGAVKRTVDLGTGCRAEYLKVTSHWLSWACSGPTPRDGFYDLDTNTKRSYAQPISVLGDGYAVRTVDQRFEVIDVRGAEPVVKATYTPTLIGNEDIPWAVDVATGRMAYQDNPAGDVRVVDFGVPASPLARIDADVPSAQAVNAGAASWKPRWWLSKPAASWTLTLKHRATGTVARTLTGGEARGLVSAAWDGKDGSGKLVANGAYTWTLTAKPADGVGADLEQRGELLVSGAAASPYGTYKPVTPTRLMDTRSGLGVPRAKVGPGGTVSLKVAGAGGVPAAGVSAVVLNVTATNASATSFVSVYPSGTARTSASNLNFVAGRTVPNLVVVPVVDGKVNFYNHNGSVDLLADVAGYYTGDGTGSTYKPVTPTRLMDTRGGIGVPKAKVGPGGTVTLAVTEPGVSAVVLNVTATNASATSFVSVYPSGTARTSASNLNFVAGQTVPNLVVVPVVNGRVSFYNHSGSVDLLADVAGYYVAGGAGSEYKPVTPARLMDTRSGLGVARAKVGPGGTVSLKVAGVGGIPAAGVMAVVLNVTATGPTASSFVSVYPSGTARTSASNLNFVAGQTVPNLVVVPVVDGKVNFYNHNGSVDLLADIAGYSVG